MARLKGLGYRDPFEHPDYYEPETEIIEDEEEAEQEPELIEALEWAGIEIKEQLD